MRALAHAWEVPAATGPARQGAWSLIRLPYPLALPKCSAAFAQLTTFHQASM